MRLLYSSLIATYRFIKKNDKPNLHSDAIERAAMRRAGKWEHSAGCASGIRAWDSIHLRST